MDVNEVQDNLIAAKAFQAHYANTTRSREVEYKVGDRIMLSTFHQWREYQKKGEKRAAKFFPQWDGPYTVVDANPKSSTYTLDMDGHDGIFPIFHSSELKLHIANNETLFPNWGHPRPGPVLTSNGLEEHEIESILNSRHQGRRWQFLVQWVGFNPEEDEWLSSQMLEDCEALDRWYEQDGDGPSRLSPM